MFEKIRNNPVFILETTVFDRRSRGVGLLFNKKLHPLKKVMIFIAFSVFFAFISKSSQASPLLRFISLPGMVILFMYLCTLSFYTGVKIIEKDQDNKTYEDLLSTLLSPGEIVKGKFWAAFLPLAAMITDFFILFLVMNLVLKYSLLPLILRFMVLYMFSGLLVIFGMKYAVEPKVGEVRRKKHLGLLWSFISISLIIIIVLFFYGLLFDMVHELTRIFTGGKLENQSGIWFYILFSSQDNSVKGLELSSIVSLSLYMVIFLLVTLLFGRCWLKNAETGFGNLNESRDRLYMDVI